MNTNTTSAITALPPIRMSISNFCKLDSLLTARAHDRSWRVDALLARELKRSIVMGDSQIPSDVATMRSRAEFRIEGTGLTQISTLVYPGECHTCEDAISVLTPLGSAILGLSEGQSISYGGPDGTSVEVTMLRILHQPEAAQRRGAKRVDEAFSGLRLQSVRSTAMKPFQRRRIILATDLSARCDRAFERTVLLTREWDAQLTIVHALEDRKEQLGGGPRWREIDREKLDAESQILADLQRAAIAADVVVRRGSASQVITEFARTISCDLIVTGIARELGLARAILGSTLEALARESVAPVLTVGRPVRDSYISAVIGTNFSKASRASIQATLQLFHPAQVTVLHAYRPPRESLGGVQIDDEAAYQHLLDECAQFVVGAAPAALPKVRCLAEIGFPETVLKQYALDRNVDLIVVGLEARNPIATLLFGSTSRSLILSSPCDLLLVPADWRSPAGDASGVSHGSRGRPQRHTHEHSVAVNACDWKSDRHQVALKTGMRH